MLASRACHACYQPHFEWQSSRQWPPSRNCWSCSNERFCSPSSSICSLRSRRRQPHQNLSRVPLQSLVSQVPVILRSLRTILICNVVPRPPPWIVISQSRPLLPTPSALAELTTFALLSLDFLLLSFCDVTISVFISCLYVSDCIFNYFCSIWIYFECHGSSIFSRETREVSPCRDWT